MEQVWKPGRIRLTIFLEKKLTFGDWLDFYASYWPLRNRPDFHVIVYEDMQADLSRCVRQLADFLQVQLSDEKLAQLCEFVSFDSMKANPSNKYPGGEFELFRRGKSGKWREVFSREQSNWINEHYGPKIERLRMPVCYD